MKEYFEKIHIKSEDDLPKKDLVYIVHINGGQLEYRFLPEFGYDWDNVDWYLRPVEQKPDCYKELVERVEDIEMGGVIAVRICENVIPKLTAQEQALFVAGFQECLKWLKSIKRNNIKTKLPMNFTIYKKAIMLTYAEFCKWFNPYRNKIEDTEQKPGCYPKEFMEWLYSKQFDHLHCKYYQDSDDGVREFTLDELFEYWQNDIKDK